MSGANKDQRDAVRAWFKTGEVRSSIQSVGSADGGGRLASTVLGSMIFETLEQSGGVRQLPVRRFQTDSGETMRVPGLDDADNSGKQVNEGSTIAGTTALSFSEVNLEAHVFQAGPVLASFELLADSHFEIEDIIEDNLAGRIGRQVEPELAGSTVTSSTAINGIVTATSGAVSVEAGTTTINLNHFRDLFFSLDPAYRDRDDAAWAMTDAAYKQLTSLESGDGEPLVEPSLQSDPAPSLLGKPIHIVQDMGDITSSSAVPVMFGAWGKGYAIRDVTVAEVLRLDEKYATSRQIGFLSWARTDGRPLFSSTIPAARRPIRGIVTTT